MLQRGMSHLDEDQLSLLAAGKLEAPAAAEASAHLQGCAECSAKHQALEALLFSKTVSAHILETPEPRQPTTATGGAPAPRSTPPVRTLHRGASIGRYVLLEKLGAGGMGEVFAAYDPQLDRKVAVKLLRSGTVSADEGRARLLREAQAMARLSHQNVVAVHDVGTWEDRVFVTMEFVEGETLSEHLRGAPPWHDVLRLFLGAGQGLGAAHKAGLVHRDFKPDNVLVDATGRALVVDFGLARHQGASSAGASASAVEAAPDVRLDSPLTRDGVVLGTPGYMAPEQLAGEPTDARSDQFSFCVALYEALYGQRPFGGETLKAHANEMAAKAPPPAPQGSPVPQYVHEALVRGLRHEPKQRFESMEALLAALMPRRRVSRLRLVAALVAVSVIAFAAVGYGVRAQGRLRVCGGAEQRLQGVWDDSAKAALKQSMTQASPALALSTWQRTQTALDAWTRSWVAASTTACEATRVRHADSEDAYQRKTACLEEHLQAMRGVANLLRAADKDVVTNAASLIGGLPPNEPCLDAIALKAKDRPETPTQKQARQSLTDAVQEATNLHNAGKYAQGLAALGPAVGNALAAPPQARAEALLLLGRLQVRAGKLQDAGETLFLAALEAEQSGEASLVARAFSRLSMVLGAVQDHLTEARHYESLAAAAFARIPQDKDVEAELSNNAGLLALAVSDFPRAYQELQNAARLQAEVLSPDHPEVVRTLNNLATALARQGKDAEALELYQKTYALHLAKLGPDHPDTASSLHNLAVMYRRQGRLPEALDAFQKSLAIRERTLGKSHPETANSYVAMAGLELKLEQPDAALKHLEQALAIRKATYGEQHSQVAAVYDDLAQLQLSLRNGAEALAMARKALELDQQALGPAELATAAAWNKVGRAHAMLGQWKGAQGALQRSLDLRLAKLGPRHAEVAWAQNELGELYLAQRKAELALGWFDKALETRTAAQGPEHPSLAWDLLGRGRARLMLKTPTAAADDFARAVALREKGPDAAELAAARFELARLTYELGADKHAEAVALARAAKDALGGQARAELDAWLVSHPGPRP